MWHPGFIGVSSVFPAVDAECFLRFLMDHEGKEMGI